MQLCKEAWKKIQDFNGVWTRDLAILVRRSNQLSYEATDVGSRSIVGSYVLVKVKNAYDCVHNCEDQPSFDFISAVHMINFINITCKINHAAEYHFQTWGHYSPIKKTVSVRSISRILVIVQCELYYVPYDDEYTSQKVGHSYIEHVDNKNTHIFHKDWFKGDGWWREDMDIRGYWTTLLPSLTDEGKEGRQATQCLVTRLWNILFSSGIGSGSREEFNGNGILIFMAINE